MPALVAGSTVRRREGREGARAAGAVAGSCRQLQVGRPQPYHLCPVQCSAVQCSLHNTRLRPLLRLLCRCCRCKWMTGADSAAPRTDRVDSLAGVAVLSSRACRMVCLLRCQCAGVPAPAGHARWQGVRRCVCSPWRAGVYTPQSNRACVRKGKGQQGDRLLRTSGTPAETRGSDWTGLQRARAVTDTRTSCLASSSGSLARSAASPARNRARWVQLPDSGLRGELRDVT